MNKTEKKEFYTYGMNIAQGFVLGHLIPVMSGGGQELDLRKGIQQEIARAFPELAEAGTKLTDASRRGIRMTSRQVRALAAGFVNIIENLETKKQEINERRFWVTTVDHYSALVQLCEVLDIWKHIRPLIRPEAYPEAEWDLADTFEESKLEAKAGPSSPAPEPTQQPHPVVR